MNEDGYFDLIAKNGVPSLDKLLRDVSPEPLKRFIPTSNAPGEALFESFRLARIRKRVEG